MKQSPKNVSEEMADVEVMIVKILRIGVIISASIMIVGIVLLILTGKSGYPGDTYPTDFSQIGQGLIQFKPFAIMMLGIFCLILTPVLRVVVSIYSFYKEHDRMYVIITTAVLIILAVCLIVGIRA